MGNDFYRLWLDDAMVYTCAYFERPDIGLEAAQQAKLEYVCRKLELGPGDRVIEAGCGWGALAIYMARHYGVRVLAYNISQEQLAYARKEAARYGVADRVTFVDGDFRSITGACDVFVSIGTSSLVYPAAGLLHEAKAHGAWTVEINPEPTATAGLVDAAIAMSAEDALPRLNRAGSR